MRSASADFLKPNQDVRVGAAPRVGKAQNVLDQFGPFVVRRLHKAILLALEIKSGALFLVQQTFEGCWVHLSFRCRRSGRENRTAVTTPIDVGLKWVFPNATLAAFIGRQFD